MTLTIRGQEFELPDLPAGGGGGFAFGLHKSGSTMLFNSLISLTRQSSVSYFDFDRELRLQKFEIERGTVAYQESLQITHYLEGKSVVFGGWRRVPTAYLAPLKSDTRVSFLVRDPRDAVTSYFFSAKYSHRSDGPDGVRVLIERAAMQNIPIDNWVLVKAGEIVSRFGEYEGILSGTSFLLHRYEDIIFEKERFYKELCDHFSIDASDALISEVAASMSGLPDTEDVLAHMRQVTPGDHRRKLKSETIERLNQIFAPILARFGYAESAI